MLRTLLPILLVIAACSKSEGKTGDGSSGNSAATVTQIEKADLNGCADLLRTMLRDANSVLDGVSDVASARKAKMAFAGAMMEMMGETSRLSEQFERLEGIPGVREELEEPMQRLFAFFERQ